MNSRNSTSKRKERREKPKNKLAKRELSVSAAKSIKKEKVQIVVKFN